MNILFAFLVICAVFACLSNITDRSTRPIFKWSGKLIPPLGLLVFIVIPFDLVTSILWLIAGVVMLISIINLLRRIYSFLLLWRIDGSLKIGRFVENVTRPALSIICFLVAVNMVKMSIHSANAEALELALATKNYVESTGSCSSERPVWATEKSPYDESHYSMLYGKYGTKYRITYSCSPEYEKYSYSVRISQDETFSVVGKFNGNLEVTYGDFGNPTKVYIDDKTDLSILVKMKNVQANK